MQAKAQSAAAGALAHMRDLLNQEIQICQAKPGNTRLQNIVCAAIPVYNTFAGLEGWPQIPVPAFCTTPAPSEEKQ